MIKQLTTEIKLRFINNIQTSLSFVKKNIKATQGLTETSKTLKKL